MIVYNYEEECAHSSITYGSLKL